MLYYRDVCVCAINFKPLTQKVVTCKNHAQQNEEVLRHQVYTYWSFTWQVWKHVFSDTV